MNLFADTQLCRVQAERLRTTQRQLDMALRSLSDAMLQLEQQTCFRQKDALQKARRDVKELGSDLASLAAILQKIAGAYKRTEEDTLAMVLRLPQNRQYDGEIPRLSDTWQDGSEAVLWEAQPLPRRYIRFLQSPLIMGEMISWVPKLTKLPLLQLLPAVMPQITEIPELWLQQQVLTWLCKYESEQAPATER